jgi:hypothetical protein
MDFAKFCWMMLERRLFMPRCSVLAKLDPFEASTPIARYKSMQRLADDAPTPEKRQIILDNMKKLSGFASQFMLAYFVSCWYLSEYESDAMWKLYGGSNNCVAVRSSFSSLKACLPAHVFAGQVSYIDYETQDFPNFNMLENIVHKRRAFEHEREVRAVAVQLFADPAKHDIGADSDEFGYFPPVELEKLVHGVSIHPLADDWFLKTVAKITRLAGLHLPIHRSEMAAIATF